MSMSGGIAQLGARLNGIQKVRGSTPLISTKPVTSFISTMRWLFYANRLEVIYGVEMI